MSVTVFRTIDQELLDARARPPAEAALRESAEKFSAIFRLTPDPMALVRAHDGVVLEVNRSCAECFGYRPEEMRGRSTLPHDLGVWIDGRQRRAWLALLEESGELVDYEAQLRRRDGSTAAFLLSAKLVELGGERRVIWTLRDVSEQKQREEKLSRIAYYDALTGLPNRLLLADRLRQAIAQAQRTGTRLAVCYLDLDGFKDANDVFGHLAGDQILVEVACRLQAAVRGGDTVARLGGDEFVLVLCGLTSDQECLKALDRVLRTIAVPYRVTDRQQVTVSASIGVTLYPDDTTDPDTLVLHADQAMYAAKLAGRNRFYFFDRPLEERIEVRRAMRERIESSLATGQFVLHYQPKIDLHDGRLLGVEALVRWQHPTLGLLPPAEFLGLVEDDPLAFSLGRWIVREALGQVARWQALGVELGVSVNAFGRHLLAPGFADELRAMLLEAPDVPPERLTIELAGAAGTKEAKGLLKTIEECRALGVGFALDDFGSGDLSLARLRNLPVQEIKIDQRIVGNMLADAGAEAIVEAVIGLGRAFRMAVVAEGVETPAHVTRLRALGCDAVQGHAVARPMAAADLAAWVGQYAPDPDSLDRRAPRAG